MSFTGKEGHCNLSNWTETRQKLDWTDRKIFHHSSNRPNRFDGAERGQHGSAMHWCTAWSFKLHGESGLRGRDAYAETSPNITGLYILYWLWCHNTFSSFPSGQSSVSFQNWFHFVDFLPPSAFELLEWLQDRSRPFKSIQDPAFFFSVFSACAADLWMDAVGCLRQDMWRWSADETPTGALLALLPYQCWNLDPPWSMVKYSSF